MGRSQTKSKKKKTARKIGTYVRGRSEIRNGYHPQRGGGRDEVAQSREISWTRLLVVDGICPWIIKRGAEAALQSLANIMDACWEQGRIPHGARTQPLIVEILLVNVKKSLKYKELCDFYD